MTHTAGPWKATRDERNVGHFSSTWFITGDITPHNGERDICEVVGGAKSTEANARLIAAAPDLFDASSRLIGAFDELKSMTAAERIITGRSDAELRRASEEAIADLRAALSKATTGVGNMAEIRINDGKGFLATFENGLAISVQIGRGNYCENYHYPSYDISRENPLPPSKTAEIAVFSTDDAMIDIQDDSVKGYVPIEHVFRFIEFLRSLPSDLVKAEVELAVRPFDWMEAA